MQLVYISPDLSRVNNHIETFVNDEFNSSLLTGTGGSKSLPSTPREHETQDTVQIWSAGNKETTDRQRRPIGNWTSVQNKFSSFSREFFVYDA